MPVVVNQASDGKREPSKGKLGKGGPELSPRTAVLVIVAALLLILAMGFFFITRPGGPPIEDIASSLSGDGYGQPSTETPAESAMAAEAAKSYQESDSPGGE